METISTQGSCKIDFSTTTTAPLGIVSPGTFVGGTPLVNAPPRVSYNVAIALDDPYYHNGLRAHDPCAFCGSMHQEDTPPLWWEWLKMASGKWVHVTCALERLERLWTESMLSLGERSDSLLAMHADPRGGPDQGPENDPGTKNGPFGSPLL